MNLHTFLEEFKSGHKHPYDKKDYIEIFKNPSPKEMSNASRDIGKATYFRFIADDKTKDIYVFTPTIVHRFVSTKIGKTINAAPWELWGVAKKTPKGWTVEYSDMIEYLDAGREDFIKKDWKWLKKWVDISPLIKKVKEEKSTASHKLDPSVLGGKAKRVFNSAGKRIEKVSEEFKDSFKNRGKYVEIFYNPSMKEMMSASETVYGSKYLRFFSDAKGTYLYVFSPEVFHKDAWKFITKKQMKPFDIEMHKQIWGTAKLIKGKWLFDGSDAPLPKEINWEKLEKLGIHSEDQSRKDSVYPDDFEAERMEKKYIERMKKEKEEEKK